MFQDAADLLQVHIPWALQQMKDAGEATDIGLNKLWESPNVGISDIRKSVLKMEASIDTLTFVVKKLNHLCLLEDGLPPYWFALEHDIQKILIDILDLEKCIELGKETLHSRPPPSDLYKIFSGVDEISVKEAVLNVYVDVLDSLKPQLEVLMSFANPFTKSYRMVQDEIKDMVTKFENIARGFDKSRTLINGVFGPKIAKEFPRQIADEACVRGSRFYDSEGYRSSNGVYLEAEDGEIVVPMDGVAHTTGDQEVTISMFNSTITNELQNIDIVLSPVILDEQKEGHPVYKGEVLGNVGSSGIMALPLQCQSSNVIHLAMKTMDGDSYLDPMSYIEKRDVIASWEENINFVAVTIMDDTVHSGEFVDEPIWVDTSPQRVKNTFDLSCDNIKHLVGLEKQNQEEGMYSSVFPDINELGPDRSFAIKDITLGDIYEYVESSEDETATDWLKGLIETVQVSQNSFKCIRPESLDNTQLRISLHKRGQSTEGTRSQLLSRFKTPVSHCATNTVMPSRDTFCEYHEDCLGIDCCTDVEYLRHFHHSLQISLRYDPCGKKFEISGYDWHHILDVSKENAAYENSSNSTFVEPILGELGSKLRYRVERTVDVIRVVVEGSICSVLSDECTPYDPVFTDFTVQIGTCDQTTSASNKWTMDKESTTLGEFEQWLDLHAVQAEFNVSKLMDDLRTSYRTEVIKSIDTRVEPSFCPDEFSRSTQVLETHSENALEGVKSIMNKQVSEIIDTIEDLWDLDLYPSIPIQVFRLSIHINTVGRLTAGISAKYALEEFHSEASAGPIYVMAGIEGSLSYGKRIRGRAAYTGFGYNAEHITITDVDYLKYPLENRQVLRYTDFPFVLEYRVYVELRISNILTGERIFVLLNIHLPFWSFSIGKDKIYDETPDGAYIEDKTNPVIKTESEDICFVRQLSGRDNTAQGYQLMTSAYDEESPVHMTYCVGSFPGGCDILIDELQGQAGLVSTKPLENGIPIYFTVTANNMAGLTSSAQCHLPTYDNTPPSGRVTPDYLLTSHPSILNAFSVVTDDSVIVDQWEAIGFGSDIYGHQLVNWTQSEQPIDEGDGEIELPAERDSMSYFSAAQTGRLNAVPFQTTRESYDYQCAYKCLEYPPSLCLSFNYDYGEDRTCDLLQSIQGHHYSLHQDGLFKHFERLGIGNSLQHHYEDLDLRHNDLYVFNIYAKNLIGYESILSSDGVLADFTPPATGHIENEEYDEIRHDSCREYVHDKWESRCIEETPLPNHRFIIDGPGSRTVFNGHEPFTDLEYTRAYTYVSANWDGFHDDESGIFGYTWSVGNDTCLDNIYEHDDPHAHIYYESEWTHEGVAAIVLPDGHYHITVRALNKVEFGGPMAATVCHTTTYTIDTTPPFVHDIFDVEYDEETCVLSVSYNVSDPLSHIREVDIGYGLSTRDVYVMDWSRHYTFENLTQQFCIPDGVSTWIRIRAWNNVDLSEVGHASPPLTVDSSPPIAGDLFDGPIQGIDIKYQNTQEEICANWQNFYDEQSGIDRYEWAVGTSPFSDDIVPVQTISSQIFNKCDNDVNLIHNTTYYSTLVAVNGAHKSLNTTVSSSGVLYDSTDPVMGWVHDGLDSSEDMLYSSSPATVSAIWGDFEDPESHIAEYTVTIMRKGSTDVDWKVIQDTVSLASDVTSFNWHHFHLQQGDKVFTQLEAMNGARSVITTSTDGFMLDATAAIMYYLGDGLTPGQDDQYTSSKTDISANWDFEDPESGISHYEVAVYEKYAGTTRKIHPGNSDEWEELDNTQTAWTSPELDLKDGGDYNVRVAAINNAGLTNVQKTDGVIVDSTPPEMQSLTIGNMASAIEEVIDGYVMQTDEFGITAYWYGIDFESQVKTYWIAVGTSSEGETDHKEFQNMGNTAGGYISGLTLELFDEAKGGPIYYVTVMAENGAKLFSSKMVSSPIKIVPGDKTGIVIDGAEPVEGENGTLAGDKDYQMEGTLITAHFSGFESHMHGIVHYEWAIGTEPRGDDVQPFIRAGIVVAPGADNPGDGLSGAGKGQALLTLQQGVKYYVTVRAITGAGNVLEAVSNGVVVDTTKSDIDIISVGMTTSENSTCDAVSDTCYQETGDTITAEWTITEEESDVQFTEFCFGSFPGAIDVFNCTETTDRSSLPNALVVPSPMGQPNVLRISTLNQAGLWSHESSGSVAIDTTPPVAGTVECPSFIGDGDKIRCSWSNIYDTESNIVKFKFGIGVEEGDDSLVPFMELPSYYTDYCASDFQSELVHSNGYYVTVIAVNGAGFETKSYSQAIIVDFTPPVAGRVIELENIDRKSVTEEEDSAKYTCDSEEECDAMDAVCQTSLTSVSISWQPFSDPESKVMRYEVALGTSPGGTQLSSFQNVFADHGDLTVTITDLNLAYVTQVFASVKGYNQLGLSTTAISNGIFISRISSGLPPLGDIYVWDGLQHEDIDFQEDTSTISGQWNFDGDPCPITDFEWSIIRFDGTEIQPMVKVPEGRTDATTDGFHMQDGESYYIIVKATNALGFVHSVRSDGVAIAVEPLYPGNVRDGDIIGVDLNYQTPVTTLSGNWDGFGKTGHNQDIHHYEIAAGTDLHYPNTRNNIHQFVNVGLNTSHTFIGLNLIPKTVTYYVTVRAYAVSSAMTEVSSNGIIAGYGGEVIKPGKVTVARYISSISNITASWDDFEFGLPIYFYQWGMMSEGANLDDIPCHELQNPTDHVQELFDIYPLTDVRDNTMVVQTGLHLEDKMTYTVVVIAYDESATCSVASELTTVDVTPPEEGDIHVGAFYDEHIAYVYRPDSFEVSWIGFHDAESGISHYSVSLLDGIDCSGIKSLEILLDSEDVPPSTSSYTFHGLKLEVDRPYYVLLKTTNNAGLSVTSMSMPILVDPDDPVVGVIKDGINFKADLKYQYDNSSMQGVFIHKPEGYSDACPGKEYDFSEGPSEDWHQIQSKGIWGLEKEYRVLFQKDKVQFSDSGLAIELVSDIQSEQMLSGAYYIHDNDASIGGTYKFEIKAASSKLHAVTSIVFWDGPEGVVGDFNAVLYDNEKLKEDCSCCFDPSDSTSSECLNKCDCDSVTTVSSETGDGSSWVIVEDEIPDQTGDYDRRSSGRPHRSIGVQLHPGVEVDGISRSYVVLWGRFDNETIEPNYIIRELSFNPEEESHSYELKISPNKEHLDIDLVIDNRTVAVLHACPLLSQDVKLTLSVWNRNDYVAPVEDVFLPPSTNALFTIVSTPPGEEELCRYGKPFQSMHNPIVAFYASVGMYSMPEDIDITEFTEVVRPCIPCQSECSQFNCDPHCSSSATSEYSIHIEGLNLSEWTLRNGTEVAAEYFIKVKAMTGSGRSVTALTSGVILDQTPPVFESLYHVDFPYSPTRPTEYQGNDYMVAVAWIAHDIGTTIKECQWAIGTTPGGVDIQDFVSVGNASSASNDKLHGVLQNRYKYFVTVKAIDEAGLETYAHTTGVEVVLDAPKTTDMEATPFAESGEVALIAGNDTFMTTDQRLTGIAWQRLEDDIIGEYYYKIGSGEGGNDIIPEVVTVYNSSGTVTVGNGYLHVYDEPTHNISQLKFLNDECLERYCDDIDFTQNDFYMEPGRTMFTEVSVCSVGHVCSVASVTKTTIFRDGDILSNSTSNNEDVEIHLTDDFGNSVHIKTSGGMSVEDYLLTGILEDEELQQNYTSDASFTFSPFIVNPDVTVNNTNRFLRHRILETWKPSFYMTSLAAKPLHGPLDITISFGVSSPEICLEKPRLIFWNPALKEWHDASHTCKETFDEYQYDHDACEFRVKVCSTVTITADTDGRVERDEETDMFGGPNLFLPALVYEGIVNRPPLMTSLSELRMEEDSGTLVYQLTAYDPDGDDVVFRLSESSLESSFGTATVTLDGKFFYRPCLDCYGSDMVTVEIEEDRNDPIDPLVTKDAITVHIEPLNDNPEQFFAVNGYNIYEDSHHVIVTVEERNPNNSAYKDFTAQVGGYDVDFHDVLTIIYDSRSLLHGSFKVDVQLREFEFTHQNCSESASALDKALGLRSYHSTGVTQAIPYPCDLYPPHEIDRLSWVVSRIKYIPDEYFFGEDRLQINVKDNVDGRSRVLVVNIHVLENRCMNGGQCVGLVDDVDCTSHRRSSGFQGYGCNCPSGFEGVYCEVNINECESNPCAENFTCVDQVDHYMCHCGNLNWPCGQQKSSYGWVILLSILVTLLVLLLLFVLYIFKKKQGVNKVDVARFVDITPVSSTSRPSSSTRRSNKIHPVIEMSDGFVVEANAATSDFSISHVDGTDKEETCNIGNSEGDADDDTDTTLDIKDGASNVNVKEQADYYIEDLPLKACDATSELKLPVVDDEETVMKEMSGMERLPPLVLDSLSPVRPKTATPVPGASVSFDEEGIETTHMVEQRFGFVANPRRAKLAWNHQHTDESNV
ncbi:uncharacterized protein [Ptychodera flava]|uniref:uncharacterized protein n=1 Tax=Ptychodera flava TaxID=63121 RepID=UPI003969F7E3